MWPLSTISRVAFVRISDMDMEDADRGLLLEVMCNGQRYGKQPTRPGATRFSVETG